MRVPILPTQPTATRQRRELEKRPATGEWQSHTIKLIDQARQTKQASQILRDQNTVLKKTAERDQTDQCNVVNEELRKKVATTARLKAKLEKQVAQTTCELANLIQSRAKTKAKLEERRKPLKVATARLTQRLGKPSAEQINDNVERALQHETTELQESVTHLKELVENAADLIARLEKSKRNLESDLNDKRECLRLDKACLEVVPDQTIAANQITRTHRKTHSSKPSPPPVQYEWKGFTLQLLTNASELEQKSMRLRKVLTQTITNLSQSHQQTYKAVNDALRNKVKQTKILSTQLQTNLDAVNRELGELLQHRSEIKTTLQAKASPLSIIKQRLDLRRQRPNRESVRDNVEEALEKELTKLRTSMDKLQNKLQKIDVEVFV